MCYFRYSLSLVNTGKILENLPSEARVRSFKNKNGPHFERASLSRIEIQD